ncbi:MAG: cbb3-type cytochrome oxidase assembly protein CcoS [Bacteroidota bacterium]
MQVILLLAFFSLLIAGGFLVAFLWAVRSGQYEDDSTPPIRILFDDKATISKHKKDREGQT